MLVIHIIRAGLEVERITKAFSASWDTRISNADRFSMEIPCSLDVQEFDVAILVEDDEELARFKITAIEPSFTENGEEIVKVTGEAISTFYLIGTAIPSASYVKDVNLATALVKIQWLVAFQHSGLSTITFDMVNPSATDPVLKETDAFTALEILSSLCHPSDTRWRCRADLYDPANPNESILELGLFGDLQDIQIRSLPRNSSLVENVYGYFSASRMVSLDDFVTDVFADGGRYTPAITSYVEGIVDLTVVTDPAPFGFTLNTQTWDGCNVTWLSKDWDVNHNPFPERRWRRIRMDSIAPQTTGGLPPAGWQIALAANDLLAACVAYLTLYSVIPEHWTVTVPGSMTVLPGDKINVNIVDRDNNHSFDGPIYLISRTTNWDGNGGVVTTLELNTVLDSLADPLSEDWQAIRANLGPDSPVYYPP